MTDTPTKVENDKGILDHFSDALTLAQHRLAELKAENARLRDVLTKAAICVRNSTYQTHPVMLHGELRNLAIFLEAALKMQKPDEENADERD